MPSPQITVIIRALNGAVELIVKKLVLDIVANLVRAPSEGGTPVDTGWARANWIPVIGSSTSRRVNRPGDDNQTRGAAVILAGQQQSAVATVAATYRLSMGKVYILNNVPYILKLDQGHSKQAPKGFVRRSIEKAVLVDLGGIPGL